VREGMGEREKGGGKDPPVGGDEVPRQRKGERGRFVCVEKMFVEHRIIVAQRIPKATRWS